MLSMLTTFSHGLMQWLQTSMRLHAACWPHSVSSVQAACSSQCAYAHEHARRKSCKMSSELAVLQPWPCSIPQLLCAQACQNHAVIK